MDFLGGLSLEVLETTVQNLYIYGRAPVRVDLNFVVLGSTSCAVLN